MAYNISFSTYQRGFKAAHYTTTALHQIKNTIITGFNKNISTKRTILTAFNMTKAFDTVNTHQLIHKIQNTQIPITLRKSVNYLNTKGNFIEYKAFR